MHWIRSALLGRFEVGLGVMQHDVAGLHDVLQRIQQVLVEQERVEHRVVVLQVVDAFHLALATH